MPRTVKLSKEGVSVQTADGRTLTLRRGQTFAQRPRATEFFQDFAKAQGKRLVINKKKSGGAQYEYVCDSATPCVFKIKLLKSRSANASHFFISSFVAAHSAECSGSPKLTVRQAAAALTSAGAAVSTVKELQAELSRASGETISARKAYRVRDKILTMAAGEFQRGFRRLESLLYGFRDKNRGEAHVAFEADAASGMFLRAFLAHPFARHYQEYVQLVVGLDTAPLASMTYRGQLFIVTAKDGNNEDVQLAVGIAPDADAGNCTWFLQQCHGAGIDLSRKIVVADRTRGQLAAAESFGLQLRQCTRHVVENLKVMVKNLATVQVQDLVWRAQAADTEEEYESCLAMIGLTCPAAETYLRGLEPDTWAVYPCVQARKLYGWNTTNFDEDASRSLLNMSPYELLQHFMEAYMEAAYTRSTLAAKWVQAGEALTAYATKLFGEQQEAANFQVVQPSDQRVAFVTESRLFPPLRYRIDVDQRECSCSYMFQHGVPCRHFLAGLAFFKRMSEAHACVDPCFHAQTFAEQYDPQRTGAIYLLLDEELAENWAIKAPVVPKKRGRPKSKQFPTSGDDGTVATGDAGSAPSVTSMNPVVSTPAMVGADSTTGNSNAGVAAKRRCSSCGQVGHSKRTCERGLPPPAELIV